MNQVQHITVDLAGDDVPVLDDTAIGAGMVLPEGAERNADGSVTLKLAFPVTLSFRLPGGPEVRQETHGELVLHRLSGADMRPVMAARGSSGAQTALARSARLSAARMALLYSKMDASDVSAANAVVSALCGFGGEEGLPERASVDDDGRVTLPLLAAAEPAGFEPRDALVFRRLTGADLIAISQSKDVLQTAIARGTGMTPKEAHAVFDAMDAADIMAAQRVVGFLSGIGRKTGG